MSNVNTISILINSAKDYHIFSPIALFFIKRNILPHYNIPIYYSNEIPLNDDLVTNIDTSSIAHTSFVNRLLFAIEKCNSEYIWLIQEDQWYIKDTFNNNTNEKIIKILKQWNLDQLKLFPITSGSKPYNSPLIINNDTLCNDNDLVISWAGGSKWPVSHNATIFKKQYLIDNLKLSISKNVSTIWDHETFNRNYIKNIKHKHDDNKPLRIAYINFVHARPRRANEYFNVIKRGKLDGYGIKFLNQHAKWYNEQKEICKYAGSTNIFRNLLDILPTTTFIEK
tara:strand:- start:499 stop:1344 length:846 start_codon:yes stop_codon:yes gene_type:complete